MTDDPNPEGTNTWMSCADWLRDTFRDLPHRITPVLRSETPFAEVDDASD